MGDIGRRNGVAFGPSVALALVYNVAAIPLAAGAFYSWTGWLLDPMIGAAAIALSSRTVVGNALRLRTAALE